MALLRSLRPQLRIWTRRAPEGDFLDPRAEVGAWIVTGSNTRANSMDPWVLALIETLRSLMKMRRPIFGICFGHQMLARAAASQHEAVPVRAAQKSEYGYIELDVLRETRLLPSNLGPWVSFAAHQDEVVEVPEGWNVFASSKDCAIQGMEHPEHPWFSVQFHPEKDISLAGEESDIYGSDGRLGENSDRLSNQVSENLGLEFLKGFLREAGL